jgi:hypothetical protein
VTDFQDSAGGGANSLSTHWIPQLVCAGFTNTAAALSQAYSTLKGLHDQNALNVILVFTDGQPNTVTFGPDYGTGTSGVLPVVAPASGGTCVLSSLHSGLSGTMAGDVSYGVWGGIYQASNNTYPVSSGGDFGSANYISSGQGRSSGCTSFVSTPSGAASNLGHDIGALPNKDSWGNLINSSWSPGSGSGYTFPENVSLTGSSEFAQLNLQNAGINALDNAANNARADASAAGTPFVIYTIGLGNDSGGVPDMLLRRVANDPSASGYSTTYPAGIYVSSPDTAHLAAAFATIADDIMRISK